MPIRLNLLAEAQAAEDLRRRDPVKRALWLAGLITALMLVWSSYLQLRIALANGYVTRIETEIGARTNEYRQILDNQKKITEVNDKLRELRRLASSRLLNGTLLNAMQHTTVEDVQLSRLRLEQLYTRVEGTKTRTNDAKVVIPGKPPAVTERILVNLESIDSSPSPGDQVDRVKSVLATNLYFKDMLAKANPIGLKSLSSPTISPVTGKPSVIFTLECRFLEQTR